MQATVRMAWVSALVISASLLLLVQAVNYEFRIVENAGDNQLVGQIQVAANPTDFSFDGPSEEHCLLFFTIDSSGSIRTIGNIDREAVVQTTGSDVLQCIVAYNMQRDTITITILDVNDNVPRFFELHQPQMQTLSENSPPNQVILRLEPVDKDRDQNGTTAFEISNGNEAGHFGIQVALGADPNLSPRILVLVKSLIPDTADTRFNLTITIRDLGDTPQVFNQLIIIDITNSPDEPPTFPVTSVMYNIPEDHPVGIQFPFANITASNVDQVHGDIFYFVRARAAHENGDFDVGKFILVNISTGEMYLNQSLDYEDRQQIEFRIVATNPSSNADDDVFVTLNIEDVNDNSPHCLNCQSVSLVENSNFTLINIAVQDDDISPEFKIIQQHLHIASSDSSALNRIEYIVENPFFISTIQLTILPLDREQTPNFTIEVTFFNVAEPFLNGSATISVTVLDINDNSPHFIQDSFTLRIAEGAPVGKEVSILQAIDEDTGRNGTITYALESVDHPSAQDWFHLSPTNGTLSIASSAIDYTTVSGRIQLNISATDNSDERLATFAEVVVEISPTLTFSPNSYVEYKYFNIVNSDSYSVYLELRTKRSEGLIFFQQGEAGDVVLLELVDGRLRFQHGSYTDETSDLLVSDDRWYSVLLQRQNEVSLLVWETQAETELVEETLFGATLFGCEEEEVALENPSTAGSLFIGGVNLFSLDDSVVLRATEFVGTIRSVLINSSQIDLGCPTDKVNIMEGFHYSNACSTEQCENDHTAGCVDFAPQPYCKCIGGFPPASCQPLPNPDLTIEGSEDSYAPIRFRGDARADLQLDYSFFSDLEAQRRQAANTEVTTNTDSGRRKRAAHLNGTIQIIEISFKLVEVRSSVLLYSKTATTIHSLEINGVIEDTQSIIYRARPTDQSSNMDRIYIPVRLRLRTMTLYNVTVTITKDNALVSVKENGQDEITGTASWMYNIYAAFVEQPSTVLSIGGSNSENVQYFEGCIRRVAIDTIEIPLTGLLALSPEDGGFMASTMAPEMYCELCDLTSCLNNSECVRAAMGEPTCTCQTGYEIVSSQCVLSTTELPTGGLTVSIPNSTYIIAGSVGAGVLIIVIVMVIVLFRCCHKKRDRQKRTYSVSNIDIAGTIASSKPNQYVHMQPRDNPIMTTLSSTVNGTPRHDRGSSVSTFQEHAEDGDPEVETPRRFSRRKSTVSAESGIRTDTDQEISLRSIPRMEDSGNEKDTDYSEGDSGSDDLSSTCFVQSPIGIQLQLVSSSNSITAMGSNVSSPHSLTPKERKMIIPLRPPSTALSASEFEDGHHHDDDDTDVELAYPYSHHTLPSSLSRNSSTRYSGRHGSDGGETSRVESACSGGKWYKASTASDTERERERSRANKAFFTQRSEPGRYPIPPEYLSPPTFEPKTDLYPNTRRSRMPISIAESQSPVSRNGKHEAYQFPYEQSRVQDQRLQDPRLKYDNHRLRQEYSLPKGHPSVALSSSSSSSGRPRHNAEAMLASAYPQSPPPIVLPHYPRHFTVSGPGSSIPHHTAHYQYSRSCSDEKNNYRREPEQPQFQDLKSVSTINPISYWEMQDRMNKTAVDQVDPYHLLTEPYVQFEDVSTDPSVYESQITQDGPEHQSFCSQGGRERPADVVVPQLSDSELQDDSTIVTETDLGPPMPIFPSADCSSPYTATLVPASSSTSGSSTPKTPNVFALLASQHQFDV